MDHDLQPAACQRDDLPGVIRIVDAALRAGSDQSLLTDYPLVYRDANLTNISLIRADGRVVAEVPFLPWPARYGARRFSIGIISPTATDPAYRKRGYGLACLRRCTDKMTTDGVEVSVLWTREATFPFYESDGYQVVRPMTIHYTCRPADAERFRAADQTIAACDPSSPDHLAAVRRMHEAESFGLCRSLDQYRALFALPKMTTLLASRDGRPTAYLVVSRAPNKPGLIEGGGDPAALESLVRHALAAWSDAEPIECYGYVRSTTLGDLLQKRVPDRRLPQIETMMVRVNLPQRLLACLQDDLVRAAGPPAPPLAIRITDADELVAFDPAAPAGAGPSRRQPEQLTLTRRQFTSLLFGEHPLRPADLPAVARQLAPFDLPIWILDRS
jgi:GNAT superfamily N-acetyltransferase